MGKVLDRKNEITNLILQVKGHNKDFGAALSMVQGAAYRDGALPAYVKYLCALTGALTHGCEGCIMIQTEKALESGATAEQVLEACLVAISLGGTMAMTESAKVLALLKEKGVM